ncbi:MAG: 2-alkenal reductase [Candidatus Magasanikbacteria bacterium GW2011_GWA2_50_22]|uniref:2-alkenal reductase n=1 Tax=Candidatus Magasanikbacteria bacterium GW2011_GWA2_50_22 TaxID=1619043 RepID=A0A0G1YQU1_9BACT|nr:MAG: 2-alkenal reductase [Candidatus Magasanikbacteria bacterium GW2011_GWA2_50_22]
MSELRKAVLASIIISLVIGLTAGGTAGILVSQIPDLNIPTSLNNILWPPIARRTPAREPSGAGAVPERPPATDEEAATIDVVRRVSPAVVSIVISKEVAVRDNGSLFPNDFFSGLGFPFEIEIPSPSTPSQPSAPPVKRQVGGGSGFIVSADGLITTNKHVVSDKNAEYTVVTADGRRFEAKVLATDPFVDLALLKIEARNLPTVRLGDSDRIRLGETVIAIGNVLSEFPNTVTKGVISGVNRRVTAGGPLGAEVIEEALQTDAAINPGNSGGPLVNLRGEVIGINTAVSQAGQLVGFAIPVNVAKPVIESVKKSGRIVRPWLGVRYVLITPELKNENQLPVDYGALVVRGERQTDLAVAPSSPADKAGLQENDIILEIDGQKINSDNPLARQIQRHKPGDKIKLKILRKGETLEVEVVLEEIKQ